MRDSIIPESDGISATHTIRRRKRADWGLAIRAESASLAIPAETRSAYLCDSHGLTLHVAKSISVVEQLREVWTRWNKHLNCDIDSFLLASRVYKWILRPHVQVGYREGQVYCLFVGQLREGRMDFSLGGAKILLPQANSLYFLHDGFLGNQSAESSNLLVQGIIQSLNDGEADFAELSR